MIREYALAIVVAMNATAQTPLMPVVLELFTSEGCSSCPLADNLLAQLDGKQVSPGFEVIALGEHVDYWDSLGWSDRFSSPLFSARQTEYGQLFKQEGVYTPQVVINGQAQCLGSDRAAILTAIKAVGKTAQAKVEIKKLMGDRVSVSVESFPPGSHESDILLAIAEDRLESLVDGGENNGRRMRHVAVVRSMTRLAKIDPKKNAGYTSEAQMNLNPEWQPRNLKYVLLVQDRTTKRIVGAAVIR